MIALIFSMVKRLITAISTPFRMMIVRVLRLFNVNVISAKLIQPLTKNIKKMMTLRPTESSDYVNVGRLLIFKQLFAFIILALCAGVFIYFQMFARRVEEVPASLTGIVTNISFRYDDMAARSFTGVANIIAFDGGIAYTGEIAAGVAHGNGMLFDRSSRLVYEGSFANNRYNGYGIQYNADGRVKYEGEFSDNLYHGTGRLFNDRGSLIYKGGFAAGLYENAGEIYGENGVLVYEGQFRNGMKHGQGTQYFADGTVNYIGEFFEGVFQGAGALYYSSGRLIYNGAMHGGNINYRALVGATLADVEAAFHETPIIYFQEGGDSSFFYPVAGVAISIDSRIWVAQWERERENPSDGYFLLPGEANVPYPGEWAPETQQDQASQDQAGQDHTHGNDGSLPQTDSTQPWVQHLSARIGEGMMLTPMNWVTIDPNPGDAQNNPNNQTPLPTPPPTQPPVASPPSTSPPVASPPSTSPPSADPSDGDPSGLPDFVNRSRRLYFEIDRDVWHSDTDLDKSRISVRKVTVLGNVPVPGASMAPIDDNGLPGVDDTVMIDHIRMQSPTAFADIIFDIDKQNRLFQRVWNINHANRVHRRAFAAENVIYRLSYLPDSAESAAYFSIEAQ